MNFYFYVASLQFESVLDVPERQPVTAVITPPALEVTEVDEEVLLAATQQFEQFESEENEIH
jgi:hypothetical protein